MRDIALQNVANIRDFGGTKTVDGKTIPQGKFLRSAALHRLTKKDGQVLYNTYHLRTVIDLRTDTERAQKPDRVIPGVNYLHIPIFSEATMGVSHEKEMDRKQMLGHLPELGNLYQKMISDPFCVSQLKKIFEIITSDRDGAILWHCTAGKDRCGLVSALLLRMLNVPMDAITADYLATNHACEKTARRYYRLVLLMTRNRKQAEQVRTLYMAEESYLYAVFDGIDARYGSFETFRRDVLGVSESDLQKIKDSVLG